MVSGGHRSSDRERNISPLEIATEKWKLTKCGCVKERKSHYVLDKTPGAGSGVRFAAFPSRVPALKCWDALRFAF